MAGGRSQLMKDVEVEPRGGCESPLFLVRVLYLSPLRSLPLSLSLFPCNHQKTTHNHSKAASLTCTCRHETCTPLPCISPPSIFINPNLSHSAVKQGCKPPGAFQDHTASRFKVRKQEAEPMLPPADTCCNAHTHTILYRHRFAFKFSTCHSLLMYLPMPALMSAWT